MRHTERRSVRANRHTPTIARETLLREQGVWPVAGVDEAGRGALAGPVVAGAVVADWCLHLPWYNDVRDSKQLTASQRERLFEFIARDALAVGVGAAESEYIDSSGIVAATRKAMYAALESLAVRPEFVLVDWMVLPRLRVPQEGVTKGDSRCLSIACASIVAKVTRDRIMAEMDHQQPGYGFARHKGYGTADHLRLLAERGASPVHRLSFRPVRLAGGGLL